MLTDPIADMLTRIRNAQQARKHHVSVPASRVKRAVLDVLKNAGFVKDVTDADGAKFPTLMVELDDEKKISLTRVSKPGQRIYSASDELKRVKNGIGVSVVSTSQGIMTGEEARKKGVGGEVICEVY